MLLDSSNSPKVTHSECGISFSVDFEFTDAILLPKRRLIALFVSGWSGEHSFLGKLYDYKGSLVATIPFPPDGTGGRQNTFWYAREVSEGVWVGFHQQNERDFGGVFELESLKYLSFNEAR